MLKDPLDHQETPYEVLGLDPNATPDEVHWALPNFMRRRENIPRLHLGMEAAQRLKDLRARMAVDLRYYNLGGLQLPETHTTSLVLDDFLKVPYLRLEELHCDLNLTDFEEDEEEILCHEFTLSPELSFGGPRDYRLEVHLDR